jgi:hypothetical protein
MGRGPATATPGQIRLMGMGGYQLKIEYYIYEYTPS